MTLTQRLRDERGMTMIELLVGIMLMAIVMSVVSTGVMTAMRVQRRQVDEVDTLARTRVAMERMTREIRAANPLLAATATQLSMQVTRPATGFNRKITTYTLVGTSVQQTVTLINTTTNATQSLPPKTILTGLALAPGETLFAYRLTNGAAPTGASDLREYEAVTITLRMAMRENRPSVRLADTVTVRNLGT